METISNKKGIVAGAVIGIAVIVALALFVMVRQKNIKVAPEAQESDGVVAANPTVENQYTLPTTEGGTREVLQEVVKTPEVGEAVLETDIAVPFASSKLGESNHYLRQFRMEGKDGKYAPSKIVVDDYDVVEIIFTSIDRDYNFFLSDFGVYRTVKKGEEARFQFQATPFGRYEFYCKDACSEDVRGVFFVNEKK